MQQQIKEQETQVKVIERMQEIELQEQEIQRKEKNLNSQVRQPAEAEKFKLETIAEANKQKAVLEAQAEAEAIQLKGEAKAFAIEAKAKAEAEQMAKKADAWNEYEKAALMDMMLKVCKDYTCRFFQILVFAECEDKYWIFCENGKIGLKVSQNFRKNSGIKFFT